MLVTLLGISIEVREEQLSKQESLIFVIFLKYLNPLKDLTFLPFSAERKIYSDAVWDFISEYI